MLHIHVRLSLVCLIDACRSYGWWPSRSAASSGRPTIGTGELMDRLMQVLSENVRGMHVVRGFAREA